MRNPSQIRLLSALAVLAFAASCYLSHDYSVCVRNSECHYTRECVNGLCLFKPEYQVCDPSAADPGCPSGMVCDPEIIVCVDSDAGQSDTTTDAGTDTPTDQPAEAGAEDLAEEPDIAEDQPPEVTVEDLAEEPDSAADTPQDQSSEDVTDAGDSADARDLPADAVDVPPDLIDEDSAVDIEVCDAALVEICDGVDNTCEGDIDEGCDEDGDGWCRADVEGLDELTTTLCPGGYGDCNDVKFEGETTYPGAPELCDGIDNDCLNGPDQIRIERRFSLRAHTAEPSVPVAGSGSTGPCILWGQSDMLYTSNADSTTSNSVTSGRAPVQGMTPFDDGFVSGMAYGSVIGSSGVFLARYTDSCELATGPVDVRPGGGGYFLTRPALMDGDLSNLVAYVTFGINAGEITGGVCYHDFDSDLTVWDDPEDCLEGRGVGLYPRRLTSLAQGGDFMVGINWSDDYVQMARLDQDDLDVRMSALGVTSWAWDIHAFDHNSFIVVGGGYHPDDGERALFAMVYRRDFLLEWGPIWDDNRLPSESLPPFSSISLGTDILISSAYEDVDDVVPVIASFFVPDRAWVAHQVDDGRVAEATADDAEWLEDPTAWFTSGDFASYAYRGVGHTMRVADLSCTDGE